LHESSSFIEVEVVDMDQFDQHIPSPGEELRLYRRLQDMYKQNAVALLSKKGEPVGYLDPSVAEEVIEKMMEGIRFRCVVSSERQEDIMMLRIYELGKPTDEPQDAELDKDTEDDLEDEEELVEELEDEEPDDSQPSFDADDDQEAIEDTEEED
jgi:hypothetical protein